MLKLSVVFVLLGCLLQVPASRGQAALPPPAPAKAAEPTTLPSDSNYSAHLDWNQQCEARVQAVVGKRVDVLFIGDSITQNWTDPDWGGEFRGRLVWAEHYASRYALNFGVGADKTENILWRMDHMPIRGLHPRIVVLLAGVNNADDSPQQIAAGVHAILEKTRQFYPGANIILVSILPNQRSNQKMMDTNRLLQGFADNVSTYYLDLVPLFLPKGDNWIGLGSDHLHPNEVGYRIWANAMEPLFDKLLPGCRPGLQQLCPAE